MSPDETKKFIKEVFSTLIEKKEISEASCAQYFSKEYIQYVDGKVLDYDHFVKHMEKLMATIKSAQIMFKHIIVEGDKVATVHIVKAIKNDGSQIEAQVNALMQIKNNKLILCDELTHLIHGEKSDKDLGSRY